jgi:hypothetical protein
VTSIRRAGRAIPQVCAKTFSNGIVLLEILQAVKDLEGKEVHEWLKDLYATLKLDEPAFQAVVNKRRIFPSQNGTPF